MKPTTLRLDSALGSTGTVIEEIPDAKAEHPPVLADKPMLEKVQALQVAIGRSCKLYDIDELTQHKWCDGVYGRELTIPQDAVIVGKMHSAENFFVLLKGEMTVTTPDGVKRISAPFVSVTQPGEKRAAYAHTECLVMNFHGNPDNEKDLSRLESRYIIPEIPQLESKA